MGRPQSLTPKGKLNTTADLQNASWGTNYQADIQTPSFDDILIWIARPTLFNRMVAAGKLP